MIVDGLVFVGKSHFGYELSADEAIASLDRHQITAAIVAPQHRSDRDFSRANADLVAVSGDSDGRLIPLARVDPWDGELAVQQLTHSVDRLEARGLFLHPAEEYFRINHPQVRPLARRAAELRIPIVVATGYQGFSEPAQIAQFAEWCPEVPVILTNGGQFNISGLAQTDALLALQLNNVHVHTSGVYRDDWIGLVVDQIGAERILFASAAPTMNVAYELRRVQFAHVPEEAKLLMLGGNVARLFDLSDSRETS